METMHDSGLSAKAGEGPAQFDAVLAEELAVIAARRQAGQEVGAGEGDEVYRRARGMNLAALAFSGGGIRSAVFNLGFLQGLANKGVVHGFDYLSTVSGGGYLGGWLSALLRRKGGDQPVGEAKLRELSEQYLATTKRPGAKGDDCGFAMPESRPVRFVRRYADYLTPRLGLSGDTLALLSLAARNMMVIQMLLVSLLVAVFAGMMLVGGLGKNWTDWSRCLAWGLGLLPVALAVALWSQHVMRARGAAGPRQPNLLVFFGVLLPVLVAGVLLAIGLELAAKQGTPVHGDVWVLGPAAAYLLAWSLTLRNLRGLLGALGAATSLGLLLHLGIGELGAPLAAASFGHAVALGPVGGLLLVSLVVTVHLALAGNAVSEQNREWWARAGGQGMFLALAWLLAFVFLLYAPPMIAWGMEWSFAGGGLWAALSWIGARLAHSADTDGDEGAADSQWVKAIAAKLAPWVFLVGLLGLVAWGFALSLKWVAFDGDSLGAVIHAYHASLAHGQWRVLAAITAGAVVLFAFLAWRIDLNIFSAHSFYRNRLARSFLGASHEDRRPNAFTGFDPRDDIDLAALAGQRPIHLLNANLNLTGGEELAWQTRRGASFVFTPHYCGYSTATSLGRPIGGFRPTAAYGGGLTLATAVAVSGAAVSPNMGFHTATSVSALLTAFNMRLARWCPNPTKAQWYKAAPTWSAEPLFAELTGNANGHNPWLNISDGGHFENLGIYELVRRRVGLIVVTDVGTDPDYHFDDLAMLVRKLSVDFGVELEIDAAQLEAIRPPEPKFGEAPEAPRFSRRHWAIGRIHYPDGCAPGYLVYVKNSLTADAPVDIRQYRDAHPSFPHETTADQWFDEDQFEAYRHLGQDIAEGLMDALLEDGAGHMKADELVRALQARLETLILDNKEED